MLTDLDKGVLWYGSAQVRKLMLLDFSLWVKKANRKS